MPIPHDPRVRAVLEAVASVIAAFDIEDPSDPVLAEADDLRRVAVREFPGHTAEAIRTFAVGGIRTADDARLDPQPGDFHNNADSGSRYVIAVRYRDLVFYDMPGGACACSVRDWSEFPGTFHPAAP